MYRYFWEENPQIFLFCKNKIQGSVNNVMKIIIVMITIFMNLLITIPKCIIEQ